MASGADPSPEAQIDSWADDVVPLHVTEDTSTSALPTTTGGRGIYYADFGGKNYFRVTIDSDFSGKLRIDKYVDGTGYTTTGWIWR